MKRYLPLFAVLTLLLFVPVMQVFVQDDTSPQLDITGVNTSRLPEITAMATVFDSTRKPITTLTMADFDLSGTVLERATLVDVRNITDDDLPFATVLMIDTSESMRGSPIVKVKEAAKLFVQSVGENDPIAVMSFDNAVRLVLDYTTDKNALIAAIDGLRANGRTALYDAGVQAVEKAAASELNRRAVILLGDGAEFGGVSGSERGDGLQSAIENGVSVFSIGLGFGADRRYLQAIADGTNARFYESPTPDDLTEIYNELAGIFRSQYILTLDFAEYDERGDAGDEYDLTLQANTPDGTSNSATATVRVPIPIPVVRLDDSVGAAPISEPVTITPTVIADDIVQALEFSFDGVNSTGDSITIDPLDYAPGDYTLGVRVTDEDGDFTAIEQTLTIAALAPDATLNWDVAPDVAVTDVQNISVTTGGQTPVTQVTYTLDEEMSVVTDAENNFPFSIDPANLDPGTYTLTVDVLNDGGATTALMQDFMVGAIAPTLALEGVPEDGVIAETTTITAVTTAQNNATVDVAYNFGEATDTGDSFTIDPVDYAPGSYTLNATATDANEQTASAQANITIEALASEVVLIWEPGEEVTEAQVITLNTSGQTDVTRATYSIVGMADDGSETTFATETVNDADSLFLYQFDPFGLAAGEYTLRVEAVNAGGMSTVVEQAFTVGNVAPQINSVTGIEEGQLIDAPVEVTVDAAGQPGVEPVGTSIAVGDTTLESNTIDPAMFPPGTVPVTISVTDANEQVTSQTINVEIVALAPVVETSGVDDGAILTQDAAINLDIESQSDVTEVTYSVDGGEAVVLTPDADGTYPPVPVDSTTPGDGEHTITITVTNADGSTTTQDVTFTVLSPTMDATMAVVTVAAQGTQVQDSVESVSTVGAVVQSTATQAQQEIIDAQSTSVVRDVETVSESVTQQAIDAQESVQATLDVQATAGAVVTVGAQSTQIEDSVEDISTLDAAAFGTATQGVVQTIEAQGTADANATLDTAETLDAQATLDEAATLESIQATTEAELVLTEAAVETLEAIDAITQTFEAQPTDTATPTASSTTVPATDTPVETEEATDVAAVVSSPTDTEAPVETEAPTDTPVETEAPTDTPVETEAPTDTPVETEDATDASDDTAEPTVQPTIAVEGEGDSPVPGDSNMILLLCGGLGLLFIILLLVWRAMRSGDEGRDM